MITRYTKRKMLSKINFEAALSCSSSTASRPTARIPNSALEPKAEVGCNPAHSAQCSFDPGNPVCEKPSTPPLEGPHGEFWQDMSPPPDLHGPNRHRRKKDNQYRHWQNTVIPTLIQPYLDILQQTDHMRLPLQEAPLSECQCVGGTRPLTVLGVSWTSELAFHRFKCFS